MHRSKLRNKFPEETTDEAKAPYNKDLCYFIA